MAKERQRIVFLCVENSCRSQMAEALARMRFGDAVEVHSAGSRPSGQIHPLAISGMRELGYDMAGHWSKGLDELPDVEFDLAVTMGCGDECPALRARRRLDWAIPQPKHLPPEEFRKVRDLIRDYVIGLQI
jgi:protein-tyrosine-phosphatase